MAIQFPQKCSLPQRECRASLAMTVPAELGTREAFPAFGRPNLEAGGIAPQFRTPYTWPAIGEDAHEGEGWGERPARGPREGMYQGPAGTMQQESGYQALPMTQTDGRFFSFPHSG